MDFNEQLLFLRRQHGLSQEQLGQLIGVSRQTVSKWELGETTPELDKLIQLSDYFEITVDELIGHTGCTQAGEAFAESAKALPPTAVGNNWQYHYEYKSARSLFGLPLVHINIGRGFYKAKGIIAIGTFARGFISIGAVSLGILSLGMVSLGLISFAALSAAILLSIGAVSVGTIAVGGLAVGYFALGGCAVGVYSLGGFAAASRIAAGGYAHAPIAIGDRMSGQITFDIHQASSEAVRSAILRKFPNIWKWIANLFASIV